MRKIGIVGQVHDQKFGVNLNYLELMEECNLVPVLITPMISEDFWRIFSNIEGLILPGGADVNSARYGQVPSFSQGYQNPILEYFDTQILPVILHRRIPVFGICRGMQTLNVAFGGSLIQDLAGHPHSATEVDKCHAVCKPDSEKKEFDVNSFHHQGLGNIGKGLTVTLYSNDYWRIPEAISGNGVFAVQWHPERIWDEYSLNAIKNLFR